MSRIMNSSETGKNASSEALEHKERDLGATEKIDEQAEESSKRAGERMKRHEAEQGIFTK
jgi:hypothetical protein